MIHNVYSDYGESMMYTVDQMKKNGHLVELHESRMITGLVLNLIRYYPQQTASIAPRLLQMTSIYTPVTSTPSQSGSGVSHDE